MAPDIDRENQKLYISTTDGKFEELYTGGIVCVDTTQEYVEPLYPQEVSCLFGFKLSKKQTYNVKKALGLIKPIYKRKKKGKRYILYEKV